MSGGWVVPVGGKNIGLSVVYPAAEGSKPITLQSTPEISAEKAELSRLWGCDSSHFVCGVCASLTDRLGLSDGGVLRRLSFEFCVHLGSHGHDDGTQIQPGENDDDRFESAEGLVVGTEVLVSVMVSSRCSTRSATSVGAALRIRCTAYTLHCVHVALRIRSATDAMSDGSATKPKTETAAASSRVVE